MDQSRLENMKSPQDLDWDLESKKSSWIGQDWFFPKIQVEIHVHMDYTWIESDDFCHKRPKKAKQIAKKEKIFMFLSL